MRLKFSVRVTRQVLLMYEQFFRERRSYANPNLLIRDLRRFATVFIGHVDRDSVDSSGGYIAVEIRKRGNSRAVVPSRTYDVR